MGRPKDIAPLLLGASGRFVGVGSWAEATGRFLLVAFWRGWAVLLARV